MATASAHLAKAMSQIQHKKVIPTIDFSTHQLEDGTTVSTQERVVKEVHTSKPNEWQYIEGKPC